MEAWDKFRKRAEKRYAKRESCAFDQVLCDELEAICARRDEDSPDCSDPIQEAHDRNLFGLALSGGGIRSATFNLGVLEAISRFKLLQKVDYLSTVSGGGYIGGWLSAWIRRDGQAQVQDALGRTSPPTNTSEESRDEVSVDPYPITQLRRLSNYLTPKVGLFSIDTFVLIATYLRNFVLNLLVIVIASSGLVFLVRMLIKICSALEATNQLGVIYLYSIGVLYTFAGLITAFQLNGPYLVPTSHIDSEHIDVGNPLMRKAHLWVVFPLAIGSVMFAQVNDKNIPVLELREYVRYFFLTLWLFVSFIVFYRHLKTKEGDVFRITSKVSILLMIAMIALLTASASYLITLKLFQLFSSEHFKDYVPALGGPLAFCGIYTVTVLFIGLGGRRLTEEQRQWLSRIGAWMLMYSLVWVGLLLLVQFGPKLLNQRISQVSFLALFLTIWPTISAAGAYSGHRIEAYQETAGFAKRIFMQATPYVFVIGLLLFNGFIVAEIFDSPDSEYWLLKADNWYMNLVWALGLTAVAILLSSRIDINEFSMHNFYKARLVRAYLGASHVPRKPDPFTQFSRADDIFLSELRFRKPTSEHADERYDGPIPIISCALNLVGTRHLALQERKANSFMFSPYYFGHEYQSGEPEKITRLGERSLFRSLRRPAYRLVDSYDREITLGECIAISGAAVSPNMGFRTTSGLAFLLTVFNVRLGAWMANPRVETRLMNYLTPKTGFYPLLAELFGMANERTRYVYLSDGGHFENLGIYELVRRRCRYIVVSDAASDGSYGFADLANAIRKVRTDFGIEIDIDVSHTIPGKNGLSESHFAVGLIHYDRVHESEQPGFLIYIKASLTGNEPSDVLGYKSEHKKFPHQSTADQWFTESQFGSYRVLGRHIAEEIFRTCGRGTIGDMSLEEFFSHLRRASYPLSEKVQRSFTSHAAKLQGLLSDLSQDSQLQFLDEQLFPDSYRFRGDLVRDHSGIPKAAEIEKFRKGFYFCSRLLQLMENVFIDLSLDREFQHPDNRGWMNLFNHWTSADMLRLTYALSAATYGARFQKFCEDHFELDVGEIEATEYPVGDGGFEELAAEALACGKITVREFGRISEVNKKISEDNLTVGTFWIFHIRLLPNVVDDMQSEDETHESGIGPNQLPCGFAIVDDERQLIFLRIRDHLRGLGLARRILYAMSDQLREPLRMSPKARGIYESIVRYPQRGRYFEILLHSLRSMQRAAKQEE